MITLQDRTEVNKSLDIDKFFPPFFSVLLPELARPQYLRECLNSLWRYADMPIETIVHEDGGGKDKQRIIFEELRPQISTIVFNNGFNAGLGRAFNRCRAMASSKYLLGFNTDTYMTSPFLKRIKTALDLPYVGVVNVVKEIQEGPGVYVAPDGTKIQLMEGMGNFHCAGMRTEVWDAAGGWDENVQTTASDVGFLGSVFGLGLFGVLIEGTVVNEMWTRTPDGLINDMGTNHSYVACSDFTRGDNNVPPIFGIPQHFHDQACEIRRDRIWHGVNDFILSDKKFPFWYNSAFQIDFFNRMFLPNRQVDWEVAKTFGHDRWRDSIVRDFHL